MDYAHPAVQGVIYCDKLFAIENIAENTPTQRNSGMRTA